MGSRNAAAATEGMTEGEELGSGLSWQLLAPRGCGVVLPDRWASLWWGVRGTRPRGNRAALVGRHGCEGGFAKKSTAKMASSPAVSEPGVQIC